VVSARRAELRADARFVLRRSTSDWVKFHVRAAADDADALSWFRVAVDANPA
jgi:hypothetical protein